MLTPETLKVRQFLEAKKVCPVLQGWWGTDPETQTDKPTEFICNHINRCEVCQVALVANRLEES